jgi:hypothetical protein
MSEVIDLKVLLSKMIIEMVINDKNSLLIAEQMLAKRNSFTVDDKALSDEEQKAVTAFVRFMRNNNE